MANSSLQTDELRSLLKLMALARQKLPRSSPQVMTTVAPTPAEDVELTLIQRDANDLVQATLGPKGHPDAGKLAYPTMPLTGLVTEESYRYISELAQRLDIQAPNSALFSRFARTVTKTRARIKLFDDTDGYADGLTEILALAHDKSVEWFCAPHRGLFRLLLRRVQPDLGIYFVGQHVIATTHSMLPAIGLTLDELRTFSVTDFNALGKRLFEFSYEVGAYLRQMADLFESLGKPIVLEPKPLDISSLRVTHNDFIGAKVYRAAIQCFRPNEERHTGAIIMALAHLNFALHVLPQILGADSNLLLRIQVLTAYHSANTLNATIPHVMASMPPFSDAERNLLRSRQLRNACAHYGLRRAAMSAIGTEDPFGAAIQSLTSTTRIELSALCVRWISAASAILTERFSKSSLASARVLLGDHCYIP